MVAIILLAGWGGALAVTSAADSCGTLPTQECQRQLDDYCNASATSCPISCAATQPLVARCLPGDPAHGQRAAGWRCYGVSALSPNRSAYAGGDCYCTDSALVELLCNCSSGKDCPQPPPPPTPTPGPPRPSPPGPAPPPQPGVLRVFGVGEGGYFNFLNPAVVATRLSGVLLVFSEARRGNGGDYDPVDIAMKRSTDQGLSFGSLRVAASDPLRRSTYGNVAPVVVRPGNSILLVFCINNSLVSTTRSTAPRDITEQVKRPGWGWMATGPANAIQLRESRRILVPLDTDTWGRKGLSSHPPTNFTSRVIYSDDGGLSWNTSAPVNRNATDECGVAELRNGSVVMQHRMSDATSNGCHHFALSTDRGETFDAFDAECVPDPTCQASLVAVHGGLSLLLAGPRVGTGMPPGYNVSNASPPNRIDLTAYSSQDGGRTWTAWTQIFSGSSEYSSMVELNTALVGIAFVAESRDYIGWRLLPSPPSLPSPTTDAVSPVSFLYQYNGGRRSADLLPTYTHVSTTTRIDANRTRTDLSWIDLAEATQLFIEQVDYHNFEELGATARQWTPTFRYDPPTWERNRTISPKVCEWCSLDKVFAVRGPVVLHRFAGSDVVVDLSNATFSDFMQTSQSIRMDGKSRTSFFPTESGGRSGRSSSGATSPFFALSWAGGGVVISLGWSGSWTATIESVDSTHVRVRASQDSFCAAIPAGSAVRMMSVMTVEYNGDDVQQGINVHRRLLLRYLLPRDLRGDLVGALVTASFRADQTNEAEQLGQIIQLKEAGVEGYWLDAAYTKGGFGVIGSWQLPLSSSLDKARWPHGLRPLAELAHANDGVPFILWFEIERAQANTYLAVHKPEWLLQCPLCCGNIGPPRRKDPPPNCSLPGGGYRTSEGYDQDGLVNLGDPDARAYLLEYLTTAVNEWGVDVVRIDMNLNPLQHWELADGPDEAGMTEVKYINGLYSLWDGVRDAFPGLWFDNCASGGRRIDLETLQRSVPLWRSDYGDSASGANVPDAEAFQAMSMGLTQFAPINSGLVDCRSGWAEYDWRSSGIAGKVLNRPPPAPWQNVARLDGAIAETKRLRAFVVDPDADYYPLTPINRDPTVWAAYQFNRAGAGFVMAFRRKSCNEDSIVLRLRGLPPAGSFAVRRCLTFTCDAEKPMTTAELGALTVTLNATRQSVLFEYQRAKFDDDAARRVPSPNASACPCAEAKWCQPLTTPLPKHEIFPFIIAGDNQLGKPTSVNDSQAWYSFNWGQITTAAWTLYDMQHVCFAHRHGARVVTPTGASAWDPAGQAQLSALLTNATARTQWVQKAAAGIVASGADGITIDIEGNMEHGKLLTSMVAELRAAARKNNPLAQISFDTDIWPTAWNRSHSHCAPLEACKMSAPAPGMDYRGLIKHLDFFVLMAYEMNFWSPMAGPNAPLPQVLEGIKQYGQLGAAPSALVIALPWYGYDYTCTNTSIGDPCELIPAQASWVPPGKPPFINYADALYLLNNHSSPTGVVYDHRSASAWFDYVDFVGQRHQVWLDTPGTLAIKNAALRDAGVRGVSWWHTGSVKYGTADGQAAEMWDAMGTFLAGLGE